MPGSWSSDEYPASSFPLARYRMGAEASGRISARILLCTLARILTRTLVVRITIGTPVVRVPTYTPFAHIPNCIPVARIPNGSPFCIPAHTLTHILAQIPVRTCISSCAPTRIPARIRTTRMDTRTAPNRLSQWLWLRNNCLIPAGALGRAAAFPLGVVHFRVVLVG
jgi:hypothetical protein